MISEGDGRFPSTSWSLIARIKSGDEREASKALDEICRQYHYPLYCYLRRRGCDHHDAEDVLHDFLARLLRQQALERLDESHGRLRGYLALAIGRHLQRWQQTRAKRDPASTSVASSLDFAAIEERYRSESFAHGETPDCIFERKWALEMLHHVMGNLERRYQSKGKTAIFSALRPILESGGSLRGEDLSGLSLQTGLSEAAVRTALSRLLREYREALCGEVRTTVELPDEVTDEVRYLMKLFE